MALIDSQVKALKPRAAPFTVADGGGLEIHVAKTGAKTWRLRYRLAVGADRKHRVAILGKYPEMGTRDARIEAAKIKELLQAGEDPAQQKREARLGVALSREITFDAVFAELMALKSAKFTPETIRGTKSRHESYVAPVVGDWPVVTLKAAHLSKLVSNIAEKSPNIARRCARTIREVMGLAVRRGHIEYNPATELHKEAPEVPVVNRAALLKGEEFGPMLQDMNRAPDFHRIPLLLLAYLYTRAHELTGAAWEEIDLDAALWTIPAARMKQRHPHIVPLPRQAVALLRVLKLKAGNSPWVLPNVQRAGKSSGRSRAGESFRRVLPEYTGRQTVHGFRANASHILHEAHFDAAIIEKSLSHKMASEVEAIYARPAWLAYQRVMRQAYADYLDALIAGKSAKAAFDALRGKEGAARAA